MSTRALIANQTERGTYEVIYVHHDGHTLESLLDANYASAQDRRELMELGDLSGLGGTIQTCFPYDDPRYSARPFPSVQKVWEGAYDQGVDYLYIFGGGVWTKSALCPGPLLSLVSLLFTRMHVVSFGVIQTEYSPPHQPIIFIVSTMMTV